MIQRKLIYMIFEDGNQYCIGSRPMSFDTQAWANRNQQNFDLIRVVKVKEEIIDIDEE